VADLLSLKLLPQPLLKLGGAWPLPGSSGMAVRLKYEVPLMHLGEFWQPPARLMVRCVDASQDATRSWVSSSACSSSSSGSSKVQQGSSLHGLVGCGTVAVWLGVAGSAKAVLNLRGLCSAHCETRSSCVQICSYRRLASKVFGMTTATCRHDMPAASRAFTG
jgi:hypothetical protein